MDPLLQFIADISLDPPMYERGRRAAQSADISALSTFDYKKKCTDEQRVAIRLFLQHAGIEFDDDGWDELLRRPDAQQLLTGALWEGVRDAKNSRLTVVFCKVRQGIEHALLHPTFPEKPDPTVDHPPTTLKQSPSLDPHIVTETLNAQNIDWDGVKEEDRAHVRAAMEVYISRMKPHDVSWMSRVRFHFVPHESPNNNNLRYVIRECNGHTAYFDGVYHSDRAWYVGALPDGMHGIEQDETA